MNIQTAFSVGQSVWFMDKDTKKNAQISTIVIVVSVSGEIDISYKIKGFAHSVSEQELIKTMFEIKKITQTELDKILEENRTDLSRIDLSYLDLSYCDLRFVNFSNSNLTGINLYNANLQGANLQGADLQGANLHGADLSYAILHRAILDNAILFNTIF